MAVDEHRQLCYRQQVRVGFTGVAGQLEEAVEIRRRASLAVCLTVLLSPPTRLEAQRAGLTCSFPVVAQADWKEDAPKPQVKAQEFGYRIEDIDLRTGRATAVGSQRAQITASLTNGSLNFVELAPIGTVIVTSVFTDSSTSRGLKAVQSRHLGGAGAPPFPSQNYGFCKFK